MIQSKIAIVIPNWNRSKDLLELINSIKASDYEAYSIVVIDNDSSDDSVKLIETLHKDVTLVKLNSNQGAVGASNIGFEVALDAGADFILRLDSDTVIAPDYINLMIKAMESNGNIGAAVGKIYYNSPRALSQSNKIWSMGALRKSPFFDIVDLGRDKFDDEVENKIQRIDFAWSAGIIIRDIALKDLGGFDSDFFVYYEEMDFCERLRKQDWEIVVVPEAIMWHKVGSLKQSPRVAYLWNKGKVLFYRKHSKGVITLFLILYAINYAIFRSLFPKIGAGNRGPLRAALSGILAGLRQPIN